MEVTNINHAVEKYCAECSAVIRRNAAICPKCGVRCGNQCHFTYEAENGKSKATAIILALLLGGIGGHKFYLRQPVLGVVYLLFCWTLIPSCIAVVEALNLLVMSDDRFERKYGYGNDS